MTTLQERRKTRKQPERDEKVQGSRPISQIDTRGWIFIIGCIVASFLFVFGFFRSSVYQPWRLSSGWNGSSQYAVLLIQPKLGQEAQYSLFMFVIPDSIQSNQVYLMPLPDELMIELIGGYGMYPVKSSVGLYELDRRPPSWILESVRIATGIDLQATIRISPEYNEITTTALREVGVKQMLYQTASSAPPLDRVRFWLRTRSISPVNLETIDLHSSFVTKVDDQTILNASTFDRFAEQRLAPVAIRNERISLAVLNASQKSGVASRYGRAYSNMGLSLARVDTLTETEKSRITNPEVLSWIEKGESVLVLASNQVEDSESGRVVKRSIFPDGYKTIVDETLAQMFRADLVLFLSAK